MPQYSPDQTRSMANAIRALSMDAVQKANSGHPGLPMGAADVATVLFTQFLKFDAADPHWPDRDRFILSAGHGSMLMYSLLYLLGYEDMTLDEIKNFRQLGSKTAGHPEFGHATGIETTTGPLGQGIANAVGFAIAERHLNAGFGDDLVNHKTYVLAGDGCLMEGISQEAITLGRPPEAQATSSCCGTTTASRSTARSPCRTRPTSWRASRPANWEVSRCDGHKPDEIAAALAAAQNSDKPVFIACRTVIGFGAPDQGRHLRPRMARRWVRRKSPAPARRWAGRMNPSSFPRTCWPTGARPEPAAPRPAQPGNRRWMPRR